MNFSKFLQYDVGDGTHVKFWEDVWCKDCYLKEALPNFIALIGHEILPLRRSCNSLRGGYNGMYSFVVQRTIGN